MQAGCELNPSREESHIYLIIDHILTGDIYRYDFSYTTPIPLNMSFGYGVGDFLAVTKLAWKVYTAYKDYKDAPEGFSNISDEIKSLHIIVDRHKDEFQNTTLNPDEAAQLREILQGCTNVLEDLDQLRIKYMSLGSAPGTSSQAIDRIKWSQENIAELRARLNSNTTLLTSFSAR